MSNKISFGNSAEQEIEASFLKDRNLRLFIKRDDELHPDVSGNKWRKLKYNIEEFKASGLEGILTYGGAFSNHLAATAAACNMLSVPSVGIIRGDYVDLNNATLSRCKEFGMELYPVSIEEYDNYSRSNIPVPKFPNYFAIPEGGGNRAGAKGCAEILGECKRDYDYVLCPFGTGTTFAGLLSSMNSNQKGIAVAALKANNLDAFFESRMEELAIQTTAQWELVPDTKFGGFAKLKPELIEFKKTFERDFSVKLDYIYTAKMFHYLFEQIEANLFPEGSSILCLHTGGLQGNISMEKRYSL